MVSTSMTIITLNLEQYEILVFLEIFGFRAHFKSELRRNGWK